MCACVCACVCVCVYQLMYVFTCISFLVLFRTCTCVHQLTSYNYASCDPGGQRLAGLFRPVCQAGDLHASLTPVLYQAGPQADVRSDHAPSLYKYHIFIYAFFPSSPLDQNLSILKYIRCNHKIVMHICTAVCTTLAVCLLIIKHLV